jgi:hypothetical protein
MSPGFDEPGPATRASTLEALEAAQEAIEEAAADAGEQAAEDEKYADKTEQAWKDCEGELLEPFLEWVDDLGGPPIRLLDARFLIGLANAGGVLARRQDLPDGAFFDLPRLKRESWGYGGASLRVLIIFLPWLQRDHPDPKGAQLRRIAALLESFVADDGGSYAVFLSYCSVPRTTQLCGRQFVPSRLQFPGKDRLRTPLKWVSSVKLPCNRKISGQLPCTGQVASNVLPVGAGRCSRAQFAPLMVKTPPAVLN